MENTIRMKDLLFRCKSCSWYSSFNDLKFVKEALKYKRFFSCPKCTSMNFVIHLKRVEKKVEGKLSLKPPKDLKLEGNDSLDTKK